MKFYKHALTLLLLLVFCLAPVAVLAIETRAQAPDFTLKSLQGQDVSLTDFKGRLVLLKLATTWCPTCKELSGEIEKVGAFLKEQNVVVLEVFVQDSAQMVKQYLGEAEPPMTFHALLDDGQVYDAYNVYLIPRLLVVDAEQIVRFDSAGRNVMADDIMTMVKEFNASATGAGPS